jgi:hypothetical protein
MSIVNIFWYILVYLSTFLYTVYRSVMSNINREDKAKSHENLQVFPLFAKTPEPMFSRI